MYKCYKNTYAFTLVELIVVITILAVLSTIAFVSFQGYTMSARDSVRLADMSNISKGFNIKITTAIKLPVPDNKIDITASGTILTYQGYAGQQVLGNIEVHGGGIDPLDQDYYTYATNSKRNKFQILGFFENQENISYLSNNTYSDLNDRFLKVKGDELGIILNSTNKEPIQNESIDVDIVNTNNEYTSVINNNENSFSGSGNIIFSKIYNSRIDLRENDDLIKLDKSLALYLDMETTINHGGLIKLKDLSIYGRMGICKNGTNNVDCGNLIEGPITFNNKMFFDGVDDYIYFDSSNNFNDIIGNNDFTILLTMNSGGNRLASIIGQRYGDNANLFQYASGEISLNMDDTRGGSVKTLAPVDGEHFIATTFKYDEINSKTEIFIDGVQSNNNGSSWDGSGVNGSISDLFIGWQSREESNFPGFYHGFLDDIRIYNRVLSHNEINSIYESSK